MKKIYGIIMAAFVAGTLVAGCDKISDFGDINKDPNNPSTAFTDYLFTQSCRYVWETAMTTATNGYDPWLQEWPGYLSESKNNQYGPLGTTDQYSGSSRFYLHPLRYLNMIVQMNQDEEQKDLPNVGAFGSNNNQIAAATTLSAYFYMTLTDVYGPIVLSEALQGVSNDNWTPKYDSQEDVYRILDERLNEAYSLFDASSSLSSADILYDGDISKWKKFNASLRMLLAIKLSDVDPSSGRSRFAKAYSDGGMTSPSDGLTYTFDDLTWNMLYYWVSPDYSGAGYVQVPNMFIVEQMKALKDNRMFRYFDIEGYRGARDEAKFPRDQYTSFYGVPFGLNSNDAVNAWTSVCCSINSDLYAQDATINIIPAARVLLVEAEAAYRGWISADPKALYEAGIKTSFEQWGADGADEYAASAEVAYNAANGLEQIAIQRWIAGYMADGVEAWSDWRRLDIPYMPVGPGAVNAGNEQYPYRLKYYSDTEPVYNYDNYVEAVRQLSGGDEITSRVWWDVADNRKGVLTDEQCTPPAL